MYFKVQFSVFGQFSVSHETWQLLNSFECHQILQKRVFEVYLLEKSLTEMYFNLKSILLWYDCHKLLFIFLKKTLKLLIFSRTFMFCETPCTYPLFLCKEENTFHLYLILLEFKDNLFLFYLFNQYLIRMFL